MKKLLLIFALIGLQPATAQETAQIQIRTLCFERVAGGVNRLAVLKADKSLVEMKFPESFPSPKTKVPLLKGQLVFLDPANAGGGPVAVAKIPAGMKNALIIFFPTAAGEEGKPPYRTVAIDASIAKIPKDGALIMNLFPSDVRAVVGEHRVLLKSGKTAGLARPETRNNYNMAPVIFQQQDGTEWKTVAETVVRFPPGLQQFFVSYPDSRTQRLAIRAYQIDDL